MTTEHIDTPDNTRVTELDNGLRVVSAHMPHAASVSLGIWVGAGTRAEAAADNGVAHLLEHMAFKGTARRDAQAIAEEIEAVGGHLNAYTSRESTAYYAKVLSDDAGLALDIIADILLNPAMDEEELGRERTVVLQEIGQAHDTPDDIIFDHFQSTAYPDQPLGRPVLGTVESVRGLGRRHLTDYMGRYYGAPTMVLSAAGRIDHDWLVAEARRQFAAIRPVTPPVAGDAAYAGGEYREKRDLEQLHLILGFPAVTYHDEDYQAATVFSTLFGGGMSSRLFQEIREKRGLVYSVYTFLAAFADSGLLGIYVGTGGEDARELVPVLADEINKLVDTVSEEEVARARAQLKASLLMGMESTTGRAEQLGNQMLIFGRPLSTAELTAKVEAVDCEAVRRVAGRIFSGRPTLAALGQTGALEPYDRIAARLG
ncbi:MAG: pitrilysin family protein [Azospirillaceae bacterium]